MSESRVGSQGRALQRSQAAVKAFITADVEEIEGVDLDKPVEALLFVSGGQDFAGAGSKKGMQVSGAQVSFSLMQDGKELEVKGLTANPIQLTVPVADPNPNLNPNPNPNPIPSPNPKPNPNPNPNPTQVPVADPSDTLSKCTGQPDPRNQMKALASHEPACAETLECRYWDEANPNPNPPTPTPTLTTTLTLVLALTLTLTLTLPLTRYWDEANTIWSTDGCVTKVYNGTDGGAFTGCECSHLSEFVSITVLTD